MFGTTKKAVITGMVIAASALAGPAVASAAFPSWSPSGAADAAGTLTWTLGAYEITCDVDLTADLVNDGTMDGGDVTSFDTMLCFSNHPRCTVYLSADLSPPWGIFKFTNNPNRLGVFGMSFILDFWGISCPLDGVSLFVGGGVEGEYDGSTGELVFNAAPGLTSALGNLTLSGFLEVTNESSGLPVDLI